ncbi:MAG: hypothetical protein COV67_15180 [Nitrospinae bacterium CG11_big_fil_rev_8_21_14_0_20_56_8]|nr:MAG: hypothetical protein COV67_15180 [Nitrospinae bacterium CG11_big_fil_rev_8_21_14_0_20_56_8]
MRTFKFYFGLTLLFLVVIFTLQNTEVVPISFLFWNFEVSRALMIFIVLGIGILVGWFLGTQHGRERERGLTERGRDRHPTTDTPT